MLLEREQCKELNKAIRADTNLEKAKNTKLKTNYSDMKVNELELDADTDNRPSNNKNT